MRCARYGESIEYDVDCLETSVVVAVSLSLSLSFCMAFSPSFPLLYSYNRTVLYIQIQYNVAIINQVSYERMWGTSWEVDGGNGG